METPTQATVVVVELHVDHIEPRGIQCASDGGILQKIAIRRTCKADPFYMDGSGWPLTG